MKMSRFSKKFLRDGEGLFSRKAQPAIYLGAYGKHPGWDDHIDDIGLETESLLLAKQVLYVEGIGGQIDSGGWDKLPEEQRLPEFKHIIVWKRGDAFLLGRIWSSRDGKKRTKYPMIVCAHCVRVPLHWALREVLPALESVENLCKNTDSAQGVRDIIGRTLAELRYSFSNASLAPQDVKARAFTDRLDLGDTQEKLFRVMYYVCTRLARCLPSQRREAKDDLTPGQIRLPAAADSIRETLTFWSHFLESQFGPDIPILLTLPIGERWLDATSGEPTTQEFYSLRILPEALTITSDVPYNIDDEFRKMHQDTVRALMAA
jgi:hypothetical protein